jgi:RimJ/RimL family protein N-acetyltransferase
MTPTLKTRRLVLRAPQMADAERIATSLNNFAVSGNLARVPYPYHLSDARAWLRSQPAHPAPGETNFGIDFLDQGFVGQVGFHAGSDRRPVLGYWLAEGHWGQGIMSEAVIASLDWFFATARERAVISGVFVFNTPSFAIQKKLGFTVTGQSRLLCLARGEEVEHIDTEITRLAWENRQNQ